MRVTCVLIGKRRKYDCKVIPRYAKKAYGGVVPLLRNLDTRRKPGIKLYAQTALSPPPSRRNSPRY